MRNSSTEQPIGQPTGEVRVAITRLPAAETLDLPAYATELAAGMDLAAAIAQNLTLAPSARALIPTGLAIALPGGYEAQIRPRSGLAARNGLTVLNAPGTIDADYRGEIKVILANLGVDPFIIERGMRIAQLVVAPVTRIAWTEVDALPDSVRGASGFGSTGGAG